MPNSVTAWIAAAKDGDENAVNEICQRYFKKLIRHGKGMYRDQFNDIPRPSEDEEDAANSALKDFFRQVPSDFPKLNDRDDLWNLLVKITCRKIYSQRNRQMAIKRGSGKMKNVDPYDLDATISELSAEEAWVKFEDSLRVALEMLDEGHRDVARMLLEDKSHAEIAAKLGVHERTVYRRKDSIREIWDESDVWGEDSETPI